MRRLLLLLTTLQFGLFVTASAQRSIPEVQSVVISSEQLPNQFDETVMFEHISYSVNAESLLTELSNSGVRVSRAWLPLDDRCMAIIGPRFTVELSTSDSRILEFGFKQGEGRLRCAGQLKQYSITQ